MATYSGTGAVTNADFKSVTWTGKTKSGQSVVITLTNAINMGNIDWTFAEKDDTVAAVTFTACYDNTDAMASTTTEPWSISYTAGTGATASGEIMLGAGVFAIGGTDVALTRGGGSFSVEREYRNINADGDRGPVKGRVVMEGSTATLTLNSLQILTRMDDLYGSISST